MRKPIQVGRSELGGDGRAFAPNRWVGGHFRHGGIERQGFAVSDEFPEGLDDKAVQVAGRVGGR
jgi:hypothetical protein